MLTVPNSLRLPILVSNHIVLPVTHMVSDDKTEVIASIVEGCVLASVCFLNIDAMIKAVVSLP